MRDTSRQSMHLGMISCACMMSPHSLSMGKHCTYPGQGNRRRRAQWQDRVCRYHDVRRIGAQGPGQRCYHNMVGVGLKCHHKRGQWGKGGSEPK